MPNVFRRAVQVFVDANLTPAARSAALATYARTDVADLISSGRASPLYTRYVDGAAGADDMQVRQSILYQFNALPDVVAFAVAFLRARSPVESGRFRNSFRVAVDGRSFDAMAFDPATISGTTQQIIIFNTQPYERKIDVQRVGKTTIRFSVPAGLFNDCVAAINARFRNRVVASRVNRVSFDVPAQYILKRGERRGQRVDTPALVIVPYA